MDPKMVPPTAAPMTAPGEKCKLFVENQLIF